MQKQHDGEVLYEASSSTTVADKTRDANELLSGDCLLFRTSRASVFSRADATALFELQLGFEQRGWCERDTRHTTDRTPCPIPSRTTRVHGKSQAAIQTILQSQSTRGGAYFTAGKYWTYEVKNRKHCLGVNTYNKFGSFRRISATQPLRLFSSTLGNLANVQIWT